MLLDSMPADVYTVLKNPHRANNYITESMCSHQALTQQNTSTTHENNTSACSIGTFNYNIATISGSNV